MAILLDTDILIDHLKGVTEARDLLLRLESGAEPLAISVITVAEIEAGLREGEQQQVEYLFAAFSIYPIDRAIAEQGGRYRARFGASHGVLLPDALIAATAKNHDNQLLTLNEKHYPMNDVNVNVPYRKSKH